MMLLTSSPIWFHGGRYVELESWVDDVPIFANPWEVCNLCLPRCDLKKSGWTHLKGCYGSRCTALSNSESIRTERKKTADRNLLQEYPSGAVHPPTDIKTEPSYPFLELKASFVSEASKPQDSSEARF